MPYITKTVIRYSKNYYKPLLNIRGDFTHKFGFIIAVQDIYNKHLEEIFNLIARMGLTPSYTHQINDCEICNNPVGTFYVTPPEKDLLLQWIEHLIYHTPYYYIRENYNMPTIPVNTHSLAFKTFCFRTPMEFAKHCIASILTAWYSKGDYTTYTTIRMSIDYAPEYLHTVLSTHFAGNPRFNTGTPMTLQEFAIRMIMKPFLEDLVFHLLKHIFHMHHRELKTSPRAGSLCNIPAFAHASSSE